MFEPEYAIGSGPIPNIFTGIAAWSEGIRLITGAAKFVGTSEGGVNNLLDIESYGSYLERHQQAMNGCTHQVDDHLRAKSTLNDHPTLGRPWVGINLEIWILAEQMMSGEWVCQSLPTAIERH